LLYPPLSARAMASCTSLSHVQVLRSRKTLYTSNILSDWLMHSGDPLAAARQGAT
jgi:hypothetical protein